MDYYWIVKTDTGETKGVIKALDINDALGKLSEHFKGSHVVHAPPGQDSYVELPLGGKLFVVVTTSFIGQEKITGKIVIACPNPSCSAQCFDARMVKQSDGNLWTKDTCWKCGTKLPAVRLQ